MLRKMTEDLHLKHSVLTKAFINVSLSKRFTTGLKEYGLSRDDIINWRYCGGDHKNHKNYFKIYFPKMSP